MFIANISQIQSAADYSRQIQEVYQTASGTIIFGSIGIVRQQLRLQQVRTTKLGVVYPTDMPIPETNTDIILTQSK
jgi:hypothetical protein